MLDESQLDEFLDEFFGEEKKASDAARLKNSGKQNPFHRKEVPSEELEEYTLPSDGMIIRQMERQGKVSRRTWFAFAVMLIVVPLLLFFSVKIWGGRKYLLCSLIVVVAAIVILTGISFGGEAGFLVGSLTMLISNMFMGQGPWTPWQMFAFGMIGFLAGILYQKGILKARKFDLCIYGFLSVFLIYGGIMNPASILMSYGYITKSSLIAYYISGAPVDLVHAASTVIFLWLLSRPLLEKLERIKVKYGLIQESEKR